MPQTIVLCVDDVSIGVPAWLDATNPPMTPMSPMAGNSIGGLGAIGGWRSA